MPGYYDDNYGWYDIEDEEDVHFYKRIQKDSVWKKCSYCNRKVKLRRDYNMCNKCAEEGGH
tara:strand:- start:135 stop:317 length:183 start_codon:yes stop_codon:yes gene_type:complete